MTLNKMTRIYEILQIIFEKETFFLNKLAVGSFTAIAFNLIVVKTKKVTL